MKPIKIDKGIPVPEGRTRTLGLPWGDMKVGDSFLCPPEIPRANVSSASQYHGTKLNMHFIVRTTRDGIRVWRDK